jgi:predicted DsbA family dithiol-disulfide isomerase
MHDTLFENQKDLNSESIMKYAEKIGVDMPKFKECLSSGKYADEIKKDIAEGKKAGVTGTPSSLLGWVQPDGNSVKAVKIVIGAQPYSVIKEAIDSLLNTRGE